MKKYSVEYSGSIYSFPKGKEREFNQEIGYEVIIKTNRLRKAEKIFKKEVMELKQISEKFKSKITLDTSTYFETENKETSFVEYIAIIIH